MPITVVTGRANSGKTAIAETELREACDRGDAATLLLPSFPDVIRARRGFAERGPFLGLDVTTLDRYLSELWRLRGDGRILVGEVQRTLLLEQAVTGTEVDLLARSASRPGFVRSLLPLARALETAPSRPVRGVADEILAVLDEYRRLLEAFGLVEPAEAYATLALMGMEDLRGAAVVLSRFTDLTASQETFVTSASDAGATVVITLDWEEGFPATRALDGLVQRLAVDAKHMRLPSAAHTPSDELTYLEAHLFLPPAEAYGAPVLGDVRLSEAEGEEAEADRIAAEVCSAVADGIDVGRIVVVFRDGYSRIPVLARAFHAAGVTAEYDTLGPLSSTGLGRAFGHLVRACAREAGRGEIAAFLRTAYSGADRETVEVLDRAWRRARRSDASSLRAEARRKLDPPVQQLLRTGERLVAEGVDGDNVAEWQEMAAKMLANVSGRCGGVLTEEDSGDVAALRTIIALTDEGAEVGGLDAFGLIRAVDSARVGVDAGVRGGVLVTSADRIRGRRFDCVIVGGLTVDGFGRARMEDAVRTGGVAAELASAGIEPWRQDQYDAERLLFYSVVTRAARRLVLSRQVVDDQGRAMRPSPLFEELLDLYRVPGQGPAPVAPRPPTTRLVAGSTALDGPAAPPSYRRALRSVVAADGAGSNGPEGPRLTAVARRADRRGGTLVDGRVTEWLAGRESFSVTDIESYLVCPYRWFYERVVAARPLDEPIDAGARGTMVHEALRLFYEALEGETGRARLTPETWPDALPLAERCLDEARDSLPGTESFGETEILIDARARVLAFLAQDARFLSEFSPVGLEMRFAEERFEAEGHEPFALSGRIDRVDRDVAGRLAVYDYKTGAVGPGYSVSAAEREGRVQVQLYAEIARRMFGGDPVAGLYREVSARNLRDRRNRGFYIDTLRGSAGLITRGDDLDAAGIAAALEQAVTLAAGAIGAMRAAEIGATPRDEKACQRCTCAGRCGRGA